MADDQSGRGGQAGQTALPGTASGQNFTIATQYLKDMSFENPNAPVVYALMKQSPNVTVNVDVQARRLHQQNFEVVLSAQAEAKVEDKTAFLLEVDYGALVTVAEDLAEAELEPTLLVEVPRLVFPFVRAVIGAATRDGGFPPLLINPVDFRGMLERQKQQTAEQGQVGEEPAATDKADGEA